ncbi:polyamine transporter 1 [Crassisporium funariophilum]|nr:polyamine transporter 1 [Crassisporium funariophilum]
MAQVDSSPHTPCSSTINHDEPVTKSDERDPYLIEEFEANDPANPKNWSNSKRWYLTLITSGIFPRLMEEFHMSEKVGILTLSLFVCGYCVGPLLWGPLSEQYGRRPMFIYPFFVYAAFQVGSALAKNTASVLVFRFLGGVFAAAPLTNSGALIADIWDANMRGKALAIFTVAPFAGPALGPTAAGFIGDNISWRWLFWVLAAFALVCEVLIIFTIPETYGPVLLARKAKAKRLETNDARFYAPLEKEDVSIKKRIEHVLARPFVILFHEPMLIALTLYMSFVYGCLYLLFTAYPIVFTEAHHFSAGISGLMFLPIPIGGALAVVLYVMVYNPKYELESKRCAPKPVAPEFRLEMVLYAGPLFAISFFWFAWTSFPHLSYWGPLLSGLLMGFSIQLIFLGLFNYIIDAYLSVAASALASSTVIRSLFGAAFPLFASDLYKALDPRWASSLLGFIAITMVPIPFVLKNFGHLCSTMPPMSFNGVVTKAGFMNKTATVTVSRWVIHQLTGKRIERSKKFLVHDEDNKLRKDDFVVIRNCPPISAMKRFKLETILKSPETEHDLARARKLHSGSHSTTPLGGGVIEGLKSS